MNAYLYYAKGMKPTGRDLARRLGIKFGRRLNAHMDEFVIFWGAEADVDFPENRSLNRPEITRGLHNKLNALKKMRDGKVAVPRFTDNVRVASTELTTPFMARTAHHSGGQGFFIIQNDPSMQQAVRGRAAYFQQLVDIKDEYRLHVFKDRIIRAAKKYEDPDPNVASDPIIRSHQKGWLLQIVQVSAVPKSVKQEARKAIAALGLDFGAVDACMDKKKKAWVFEVNTAPGMEGITLDRWTEVLAAHLDAAKVTRRT